MIPVQIHMLLFLLSCFSLAASEEIDVFSQAKDAIQQDNILKLQSLLHDERYSWGKDSIEKLHGFAAHQKGCYLESEEKKRGAFANYFVDQKNINLMLELLHQKTQKNS